MTEQEARALFRRHDDPRGREHPPHFDRAKATARFQGFVAALDAAAGTHEAESGASIQDASFHAQVFVGTGALRFSSFGDMACLTPDCELDEATLAAIRDLCERLGYVFVPTEYAELPYDGSNPGVTGIRDWWIRYFDWV